MKYMRLLGCSVLAMCLMVCALSGIAGAATYYMATDGSDSNPGTEAQPWATFDHAMNNLSAGDTLLIKDGTYYQSLDISIAGTESNPITFKAVNDGSAIADGEGSRTPCYIHGAGAHDIVIEGIRFQDSSGHVVSVSGCDTGLITFRRVSAYDAGPTSGNWHCFSIAYSNDVLVEDCAASGQARTNFVCYCCEYVTFRRCWAKWIDHGQTPYYTFGIYNSNYCIMENCVGTMDTSNTKDCYGAIVRANEENEPINTADYNKVLGTVLYDFTYHPWSIESDYYITTGNRFDNNVYIDSDPTTVPWAYWWVGTDNDHVMDHTTIVGFADASGLYFEWDGYGGTHETGWDPDCTVKNSLFYDGDVGMEAHESGHDAFHNSYNAFYEIDTSNWGGDASQGPGEITQDPGFLVSTYGKGAYLFIPDDSPLQTAGEGGDRIGAEVLYRYVDGELTSDPLWPWPMEDRIQDETEDILGVRTSCTWENKDGATGGLWKTLDGIYGPQAPVADFSGNPTSGDAPLTVNFTDLSSNSPTSWSWTFGDGGSSTAQNPSHDYTSAGDYTVSLTAANAGGEDTETKPDYISATEPSAPVADFSGSPTSGYAPLDVDFTDLSTENPTSWSWTFGNGGSSSAQNPSHEYTSAGDYTVSLQATNAYGSDTETKTNYISVSAPPDPPAADFSGSPLSGDAPLTVNFTDLSTGSPTSWDWTFGDGGSSSAQNPSHQYTSAGDYTVSLTATNAQGQDTETKTNYISVTEPSGETIFFDDFETGLDWSTAGTVNWYTGSPKNGSHSVQLAGQDSTMEKTISTVGYQNITVSFYLGAKDFDTSGDQAVAYWDTSSTSWQTLTEIKDGDPEEDGQLHYYEFDLPSAAEDDSSFKLIFALWNSGAGETAYVDDVKVKGDPIS